MKLIKESIDYEVYNPNEEEVEKFIGTHTPPCNSIASRISELFPGKKPTLELELAIQQRIKEDIISTLQEFSTSEVEAINYLEVVLEEMKEDLANKLVDAVVEAEPVEIVIEEIPVAEEEEVVVTPVEEAVQVKHFRITYKHETGIYSTAAIEADTYDKAIEEFNKSGKGELIDCSPISEEEFKDLVDSGIPEIGKEALTEDLNVNVDTDQSNINVQAEEGAAVDVKVEPKECSDKDAEAELAELAQDPKYAKAFAYLMNTLQGEEEPEVVSELSAEPAEEPTESPIEEPLTEAVEEKEELPAEGGEIETPAEEPPKGPENLYVANTLNDLMKGELDTINQYNDFILSIQGMTEAPKDEAGNVDPNFVPAFCPEKAARINEVVKDILVEENKHIGQLQELLKEVSPNVENIEAGADEAKEQVADAAVEEVE